MNIRAKAIAASADTMTMFSHMRSNRDYVQMDEKGLVIWYYLGFRYATLDMEDKLTIIEPSPITLGFDHGSIAAIDRRIDELKNRYPNHE